MMQEKRNDKHKHVEPRAAGGKAKAIDLQNKNEKGAASDIITIYTALKQVRALLQHKNNICQKRGIALLSKKSSRESFCMKKELKQKNKTSVDDTTKQIKGSGINAEWTRGGRGGFRRLNL